MDSRLNSAPDGTQADYTCPVIPPLHSIDWRGFLARPSLPSPPLEVLDALRQEPVLITGAGGSIGSTLAIRLAALMPPKLVLLEASESHLYTLEREWAAAATANYGAAGQMTPILGSTADRALLDEIFATHAPRIVFHAAAYKHVPLIEEQPLAAIQNNIFATETLTQAAVIHGARVVLLSTDKAVEPAVSPRTHALLVVHTFGVPAEMDALQTIARRHNLALIEDASEAIGAQFQGRRAGSFGDLAVFGFYPNKQLTTGEGGAVLARDAGHAARLCSLRNQGRSGSGDWLDHAEPGYNYRLSELACAVGRVQLGRIAEMLALRQAAAQRYDALLNSIPGLELPPLTLPNRAISWFVYVVRLPEQVDRDRVQASLARRGIATGRYFAPIHLQPAWRNHLSAGEATLPITESIASRTLALPFFNRIDSGQQEEVASALRGAIEA